VSLDPVGDSAQVGRSHAVDPGVAGVGAVTVQHLGAASFDGDLTVM